MSPFVQGWLVIAVGHTLSNLLLCAVFYARPWHPRLVQQPKTSLPSTESTTLSWQWLTWLPALELLTGVRARPGRHPRHALFATTNLLAAATFMGFAWSRVAARERQFSAEQQQQGGSAQQLGGAAAQAGLALAASAWQIVVEYYWHCLNHTPFFYRRFHKYHHYYKSPGPFDDLFIHPVEGSLYYCILYAPAWALPLHRASFGAYMVLMGTCGLMDHSGVRFSFCSGVLYDSADHDLHHSRVTVNYGFPFPWFDRLHGTYVAPAVAATQNHSPASASGG